MAEIDPIQYGKLTQSVETLADRVDALSVTVASLNAQITSGKGVIAGMMIAAAGIGAGASKLLERLNA